MYIASNSSVVIVGYGGLTTTQLLDDSDNSPGWKYSEYEMKGVPLRIEIGPRDIENNSCVLVSRVSRAKTFVSLDGIEESVEAGLKS